MSKTHHITIALPQGASANKRVLLFRDYQGIEKPLSLVGAVWQHQSFARRAFVSLAARGFRGAGALCESPAL